MKPVSWLTLPAWNETMILQLGWVALAACAAMLASRLVKRRYAARRAAIQDERGLLSSLFIGLWRASGAIFFLLFAAPGMELASRLGLGNQIIESGMKLGLAWGAIRFLSGVIRDGFVARVTTVLIFLAAALSLTGLLQPTLDYLDGLEISFGKSKLSVLDGLRGLLLCAIMFWIAGRLGRGLDHTLQRVPQLSSSTRALLGKMGAVVLYAVALLMALRAVGIDLTALAVFGGALGVGIGLGLQKLVANFVSGVMLLMERSIKPGDIIEIGGKEGTVGTMGARFISLEGADGKSYLIPNEDFVTQRVVNASFSNDLLRGVVTLILSHDADLRRAQEIMLETARAQLRVVRKPEPSVFVRDITETGILVDLHFWINDPKNGLLGLRSAVISGVRERFREEGIALARAPSGLPAA